ncbi:MAG: DUF2723 domain-containing protein [Candidatus Marinimicrobia bacterium]|nr:DUF2723 domain-containing protein [Candidatus Neomarinimicrobiota bacterium]
MIKNKVNYSIGAIVFAISFIVYFMTVAPTVSFWDCGEFIACAYKLEVPHPPGAPLFLLLGKIFTLIPFSKDIAFRMNLISVISSALTILFLYLIIVLLVEQFRGKTKTFSDKLINYGGAFIGAMTFAFTDSQWFNAVEAEVYSISTFLVAFVVWLILKWRLDENKDIHNERYILIIAYVIGVAISIHLLNLLTLPFIALIIYFKHSKFEWKSFLGVSAITGGLFLIIYLGIIKGAPKIARMININPAAVSFPLALFVIFIVIYLVYLLVGQSFKNNLFTRKWIKMSLLGLALITIGYSSYQIIFIRSLKNPNIDENNPETVKQAVSYLEREQYGKYTASREKRWQESEHKSQYSSSLDYFWNYQIKKMYIRYFNWNFMGRKGNNVDPTQLWMIPFIIGWIGMFYHFAKDKNNALSVLALFFMMGLAVVLYLNQPDPQPRERDYSYVGSFFTFAIWIGIGASSILELVKKKIKNDSLKKYLMIGVTILLIVILPLNLLNANFKEHSRWGNYVASDYAYNLLNSCDKDGILFTNGDNDTFPLWYLQEVENVRTDVKVVNLSLLNTPWYILQMKHYDPKINIPISDEQIKTLRPRAWETQEVKIPVPEKLNPEKEIRWKMEPTLGNNGIRVQDLMIFIIANGANWDRPVYFAVTVSNDNRIGIDKYLSMEGLVYKLNPKKVDRIDEEEIYSNLIPEYSNSSKEGDFGNVYRFRNLNNPDVYLNPNSTRLMQNYRTGFIQATVEFIRHNEYEKARTLLSYMEEKIPEEIIPIKHKALYLEIGRLYGMMGDTTELSNRLDDFVKRDNLSKRDILGAAQLYYMEAGNYNKAEEIVKKIYVQNPTDPQLIGFLYQLYNESKQYDKALMLLDEWLQKNPDDPQAKMLKNKVIQEMGKNR